MPKKVQIIFLLFAAVFALSFAYISQFVFGHEPCVLCLYQRQPFFAIIAICLSSLAIFKSEKSQNFAIKFCIFALVINCAIAFYHLGVEQKIFAGPTTCSATNNLNEITDLAELEAALAKTKAIRCDQPTFFFLSLSMAAWNLVFCLALAVFTFLANWSSPSRWSSLTKKTT